MKNLDKKSNTELQELKRKLTLDYEIVRQNLIKMHAHWSTIEDTYQEVITELKKRGVL
jgi:hypothetical protein